MVSMSDKSHRIDDDEGMALKKAKDNRVLIRALRKQLTDCENKLADKQGILHALGRNQSRYHTVFEKTGTATFIMEKDTTIVLVNAGFERLSGYSKKEVEGHLRLAAIIDPDDQAQLSHYQRQCIPSSDKGVKELSCRIQNRSGDFRNVLLKIDAIPDTLESIGSMVDITHIKAAELALGEQKAQLDAILNAFEGQIYVITADYHLSYTNNHLRRPGDTDVLGLKCFETLHRRKTPCSFCVMDRVQKGETVRFESKNPKNQRWYYSMNSPIQHVDGTVSCLSMIYDINERKSAEVALRESATTLRRENIILRSQIKTRNKFGKIIGASAPMQQVYENILNAAATEATALIYGEPGTGKELVAQAIHDMSERRSHRFVPVHCGAIPENLVESEFFGYKKGAFTGALADKPGYLDSANKGTIFLDEIGEISLQMQVKLLRVIEGSSYTPVGASQEKKSDVRFIAATNRDLKERISRQMMREDFFYRIHILPIELPPLRERKEDLPLLIEHFLNLYAAKDKPPPITSEVMKKLEDYNWPGNVRELQNVIIRYCSLKRIDLIGKTRTAPQSEVLKDDFAGMAADSAEGTLATRIERYEKHLILTALNQHQWQRQKVATALKIDRKTLFNKMTRFGLNAPEK